ncbi:unnamed protein product [Lactuca virosa]|uniref:Uncharacterized protein n=1 Tax=Lactuca virosa TaxID=75947 RepID=A0AAU9N538_9ASTR|nr:unnamed protein product [Lactuca virosa]
MILLNRGLRFSPTNQPNNLTLNRFICLFHLLTIYWLIKNASKSLLPPSHFSTRRPPEKCSSLRRPVQRRRRYTPPFLKSTPRGNLNRRHLLPRTRSHRRPCRLSPSLELSGKNPSSLDTQLILSGFYIIIMPRRPTRRTHLQRPQHTFSRLGRSMALLSSTRKVKQQNDINAPSNSTGRKKEKHDTIESKREVSCSSSENEDSSSEDDFEGVVQEVFLFFDPKPDDFHGVKVLMQTYLDNKEWDLTSFVDLISQQTSVGAVVKIEDESVYGFVSALNLQRYKDCKCMMEVKEFLISKCQEKGIKENLKSYIGEKAVDVGHLISQRVVYLPLQLLPSLYDALFNEISCATKDEPTQELRKLFCFKRGMKATVSRLWLGNAEP